MRRELKELPDPTDQRDPVVLPETREMLETRFPEPKDPSDPPESLDHQPSVDLPEPLEHKDP